MAIEHNVKVVRSWLKPGCKLMAVVKSDAYGHGAATLGSVFAAAGADWLGVASVDEGCQLRSQGITCPILILGPCPSWALSTAIDADLQVTVTSQMQISDLAQAAARAGRMAAVQVKIDTGMHRLGVSPAVVAALVDEIKGYEYLRLTGLFSHLAAACDESGVARQNATFAQVTNRLAEAVPAMPLLHLASGEAARRFPDTHYDMVRVGLYLYGLEANQVSAVVKPAMAVKARLNHMQTIEPGQAVGYNWTWTARRQTRLASIPIGYGDGVDRRLSNRLVGSLLGRPVQQVGLISMDQMLFDVTDVPEAAEGDVLTLIGKDSTSAGGESGASLNLATWAAMLDTITYELACRLRVRLPRVYTRKKEE